VSLFVGRSAHQRSSHSARLPKSELSDRHPVLHDVDAAAVQLCGLVSGINNLNQCVGGATLVDSARGFIRDADGTLTFPIGVAGARQTALNDINDHRWTVGHYFSGSRFAHAVFFQTPTKLVTFDYPGAAETVFTGINGHGLICGYYDDGSGNTGVGFLARVNRASGD
jgi:hypothetical protein